MMNNNYMDKMEHDDPKVRNTSRNVEVTIANIIQNNDMLSERIDVLTTIIDKLIGIESELSSSPPNSNLTECVEQYVIMDSLNKAVNKNAMLVHRLEKQVTRLISLVNL